MSLAIDSPEDKALKFLKAKKATFENYFIPATEERKEELALGDEWDFVAVPTMFLFDRNGKMVKRFENEFKIKEVEEELEQLLRVD